MKKLILILGSVTLLFAGTVIFISCNDKPEKKEIKTSEVKTGLYACPMHCEGDKTYEKPGKCPECGMDLKKKEDN